MKILVIVINYANEEEVIKYAKTISEQSIANEIELIVVNNKRSENCKIDLLTELSKVNLKTSYYNPGDNLGYLNGAIFGYNQYINSNYYGNIKWVVISNTDIIISDNLLFEKLNSIKYMDDVWCVAPSVYSPSSKSYQNPHYITRISKQKITRVILINSFTPLALIYSNLSKLKSKFRKTNKKDGMYVYSPHGCFMCMKSEFMDILKGLTYKGFLYSEESYIAENLLLNNKRCFYDNNIEVIHTENSVTGYLGDRKRAQYIKNSLKVIRDEFY